MFSMFDCSNRYWSIINVIDWDESNFHFTEESEKYQLTKVAENYRDISSTAEILGLVGSDLFGFHWVDQSCPKKYPSYKVFKDFESLVNFLVSIFSESLFDPDVYSRKDNLLRFFD